MGASMNHMKQSDGYFLNFLDQQNPRLSKRKGVAWLDFKLYQRQNQINKALFEDEFQNFESFGSLQQLIEFQNQLVKSQATLLVVCAASLSMKCYEFIQKSEKIQSIVLFCMNLHKAHILKQEFSKINHICLSPANVIREIKLWKSSQEKQFVLFSEKNVQFINKFNSTLFSLTEKSFIDSPSAQQDLKNYLKAIPSTKKQEINLFQQILDIKQKKIIITKQAIDIANELLILTTSSNVLGHIRFLMSLLFNSIKEEYAKQKKESNNVGYFMMKLKENQKSLVKPENIGKLMMITKFIRAEYRQQLQPTIDEVQLRIILKKNPEKDSNGYHLFQQNIIINPGNYFKIVNYNRNQSVLEVMLHQFDPLISFENLYRQTQENNISLNRLFILQQGKRYKGQSLSLILHNEFVLAEKSIVAKMQKCKKMQGKQRQYNNLLLGLFCLKCQDKKNQIQLEKLLYNSNQQISKKMKIEYLQFLWSFSSKQTLKKYYNTLHTQQNHNYSYKKLKLELLETLILQNLKQIQSIQANSDIYQKDPRNLMLILKIKLLYYEQNHRSKIKQQITIIEKLSKLYKLCYGCTHFEVGSLRNRHKALVKVYQSQKKKEKNTSSIDLKTLFQHEKNQSNEAYNFSLSKIKLSIFE